MSAVLEHHRYVAAVVLNNSLLLRCIYVGVFVVLSLYVKYVTYWSSMRYDTHFYYN